MQLEGIWEKSLLDYQKMSPVHSFLETFKSITGPPKVGKNNNNNIVFNEPTIPKQAKLEEDPQVRKGVGHHTVLSYYVIM